MIALIVATGPNGEIGYNGHLPWEGDHLQDKRYFKNKIKGNVIVGTNNSVIYGEDFDSCLVSRKSQYNWEKMGPKEILFSVQQQFPNKDIFVVGGVDWYHSASPYVQKVYLSRIKEYTLPNLAEHNFKTSSVDLDIITKNKEMRDNFDFDDWEIQVWENNVRYNYETIWTF